MDSTTELLKLTDLINIERTVLAAASSGQLVSGFASKLAFELRVIRKLAGELEAESVTANAPSGTEVFRLPKGTVLQHHGLPAELAADIWVFMTPGNWKLAKSCDDYAAADKDAGHEVAPPRVLTEVVDVGDAYEIVTTTESARSGLGATVVVERRQKVTQPKQVPQQPREDPPAAMSTGSE